MTSNCTICNRQLESKDDPLSVDCGGDCWGCIGEMEADGGSPLSLEQVRQEFRDGFRPNWIPSPNVTVTSNTRIKSGVNIKIIALFKHPLGEPREKEDVSIRYISMSQNGLDEKKELDQFIKVTDVNGEISLELKYPKLWFGRKAWIQLISKSHICSFPLFMQSDEG